MCGLVGIMSSNMFHRHKEALSTLLFLDTFRGRDSTGVAAIRKNADTSIMKATVPGYEFVEGPKLFEHLKLDDFVWIGHNRFGTVGKNIKSNAHPFQILDEDGSCMLVGAHNGTLKNKYSLKDNAKFGTDSEAMFNNIVEEGLEPTIAKCDGAWAVTYYDHVTEELRFFRNKERPLFYAWEEGRKTILWASEIWMLRVACSRADIKLDEDKIYQVNEDTLYRIPAPDKTNDELVLYRKGGLVGKTDDFFRGGERWASRGGASTTSQTTTAQQKAAQEAAEAARSGSPLKTPSSLTSQNNAGRRPRKTKLSTSTALSNDKVVSTDAAKCYKGYDGEPVSKAELEKQLAGGCSWCNDEKIAIGDKYGWLDIAKPVCAKCMAGEHKDKEMIDAIFGQIPPAASIH